LLLASLLLVDLLRGLLSYSILAKTTRSSLSILVMVTASWLVGGAAGLSLLRLLDGERADFFFGRCSAPPLKCALRARFIHTTIIPIGVSLLYPFM